MGTRFCSATSGCWELCEPVGGRMWRHVVDVEALQACGWAGWEAECATKVPPELVPSALAVLTRLWFP